MKKLLKSILLVFALVLTIVVAGCSFEKLELTAANNETTIAQGDSIQLVVNDETATFTVTEGKGSVTNNGLLTCSLEAIVDSKLTVSAESKLGIANISFTVTRAKIKEIDLIASSKTIKKGEEVTLGVTYTPSVAIEETINYELITGSEYAEINDGKVSLKSDAVEADIVGNKIVVKAITRDTKVSDEIEIEVVLTKADEIILSASSDLLVYTNTVTLSVSYVPTFAEVNEEYELYIVSGEEYVELNGDVLSIKENASEETINGKVVKIGVKVKGNDKVSDEIEITLSERPKVDILVEDKEIIAGQQSVIALLPEVYDENGELLDLSVEDFTFISDDESILTVGEHDGKITPVGHGSTTVTVKYQNSQTKCNIYVMVVPESIEFDNLSVNTMSKRKYYYSMNETLEFDIELTTPEKYLKASDKLSYKFELLDEDSSVIKSGDEVATVNNGKITFNVEGSVRVTISTNSSLNGKDIKEYEKSTSIIVEVNDGFNIRSIYDLKAYAQEANKGKAANFINDLFITKDDNFGIDDANRYMSLWFFGDRYLYGNGYVISTKNLELLPSDLSENDLFAFFASGEEYYTVEIHDLEVIGSVDVNGQYTGNLEQFKGKAINSGFRRAFRIGRNLAYEGTKPVKDLVISNVKVSGFMIGLRLEHIVDGYVTDINISQCVTNGIECNQNIITFNNIYVGQVGAFAIEMVPDDMMKENGQLKGTAGLNYNETAKTTLTGSIESINFNNGKSTPYMSSLQLEGLTIPEILAMIVGAKVQYAAKVASQLTGMPESDCLGYLANLAYQCLYKDADPQQSLMNFFLLVFVDPTSEKFAGYTGGNKANVFGTYASTEEKGNIITIDKILEDAIATLAAGGTYDDYKTYKYILLDLDLTSAYGINLGEIIAVNEAYSK